MGKEAGLIEPYERQIAFRADDAGCDRAGAPVARGVCMSLKPGEAVQLFGANGAGKSSLLQLFAGHSRPAEGAIAWREGEGAWSPARPDNGVFFMGHEHAVKPALTAAENLSFWARTYGLTDAAAKNAVYGALARMGLGDYAGVRASRFSAGQRRRVDFARALIARREAWLLDEPAAALDAEGADLVAAVIGEHLKAGGLAVIATHDTLTVSARRMVIG